MVKGIFAALTGLCLLALLSGCQQRECCGYPVYYYYCEKGAHAVNFAVTGPLPQARAMLQDSLNYYIGQGYTCNISSGPPWQSACVFGRMKIHQAIAGGDSCASPGSEGECNILGGSCE